MIRRTVWWRRVLIGGLLVAVSACSSSTTADTASTDASADAPSSPAADPTCEQTARGCLVYRCNCESTFTSRTLGDKVGGGCLSGPEACGEVCQLARSTLVEPVSCNRIVDAGAPPVEEKDAGPAPGKPGGSCNPPTVMCLVGSCECSNGSILTPASGVCKNGTCASLSEACTLACASRGGWSGRGNP